MSEKIITLSNLAEFKSKCDETYGGVSVGDVINLGYMTNPSMASGDYYALFEKDVNGVDSVPQMGLAIIMFNTTSLIVPYTTGPESRFVASCIYNPDGETMYSRWSIQILSNVEYDTVKIRIKSDYSYGNAIHSSNMAMPYGIIRFIGL